MYRRIRLSGRGWCLAHVQILRTPRARLSGIRGSHGSPVMLLTKSIHTFTLSSPIAVVELSETGVVQSCRVLPPWRLLIFRTTRWVVEYRSTGSLPLPGTQIMASTMSIDVGNTDPLCDADREPRGPL
ncbi:MAG: hypothetical protein QGD89_00625 [Actinomycetota bacterium]|nr:hypothetical protein [Actinomycetota bacterium]